MLLTREVKLANLGNAASGADGTKFYVITEWDRSYTTVMLAEDY